MRLQAFCIRTVGLLPVGASVFPLCPDEPPLDLDGVWLLRRVSPLPLD